MYQATLFHPEGDYVTDFKDRKTVQEVWDKIGNMGSRWFFFPICFVTTDRTIIDTPDGLEWMKRKRIKTIKKFFENEWAKDSDEICDIMNEGFLPIWWKKPI